MAKKNEWEEDNNEDDEGQDHGTKDLPKYTKEQHVKLNCPKCLTNMALGGKLLYIKNASSICEEQFNSETDISVFEGLSGEILVLGCNGCRFSTVALFRPADWQGY